MRVLGALGQIYLILGQVNLGSMDSDGFNLGGVDCSSSQDVLPGETFFASRLCPTGIFLFVCLFLTMIWEKLWTWLKVWSGGAAHFFSPHDLFFVEYTIQFLMILPISFHVGL